MGSTCPQFETAKVPVKSQCSALNINAAPIGPMRRVDAAVTMLLRDLSGSELPVR